MGESEPREQLTGLVVAAAVGSAGTQNTGSFDRQPVVPTPTKYNVSYFILSRMIFPSLCSPGTPDAFFPMNGVRLCRCPSRTKKQWRRCSSDTPSSSRRWLLSWGSPANSTQPNKPSRCAPPQRACCVFPVGCLGSLLRRDLARSCELGLYEIDRAWGSRWCSCHGSPGFCFLFSYFPLIYYFEAIDFSRRVRVLWISWDRQLLHEYNTPSAGSQEL